MGNVEDGRMNDWGAYYNKVLGLHQFMTFDDKDISTEFSALRSKVMADDKAQIKFPINEPAPANARARSRNICSTTWAPACSTSL